MKECFVNHFYDQSKVLNESSSGHQNSFFEEGHVDYKEEKYEVEADEDEEEDEDDEDDD